MKNYLYALLGEKLDFLNQVSATLTNHYYYCISSAAQMLVSLL